MTVFDDMLGDLFADANLALDAVYTPQGQPALADPVRVLPTPPGSSVVDGFGDTDLADPNAMVLRVRSSQVPSPGKGDQLVMAGATFRVTGDPAAESSGAVWRLSAVKVAA